MANAPTAVSQAPDGKILEGKRVLITGGTGSLGKVLLRRILGGDAGQPTQIIVLSRDEAKQHQIRVEYQQRYAATDEVIYRNFRDTAELPHRRRARLCERVRGAARRRHRVQRRRAQAGADLRVFPLRGGADQHHRPREHRARDPRPAAAGRGGRRHLDRQGGQAGQRHGHDQVDPGADLRARQSRTAAHPHRHRALRQRAGLARLGHSAVP